jgi:hypothetical protein
VFRESGGREGKVKKSGKVSCKSSTATPSQPILTHMFAKMPYFFPSIASVLVNPIIALLAVE